jgi:hypothetical protein
MTALKPFAQAALCAFRVAIVAFPSDGYGSVCAVNDPTTPLERAEQDLRDHLASWDFAFANGHGCTIGRYADDAAIHEKTQRLTERIRRLRGYE